MNYNLDNLLETKIKKGWLKLVIKESKEDYFRKIIKKINNDAIKFKDELFIFPFPNNVFRAFKYFEPDETKLVLLGQDPYIRYELIDDQFVLPQAVGLSFSVPKKMRLVPPSLQNIFKELKIEYPDFEIPNHGDISRWARKEKILLLNSALTVLEGNSGSHLKIWEKFTDKVIQFISDNCDNVVFLLLGNYSIKKSNLIDSKKHHIVTAVHPSPLSASRGFFNSNVFKKVNEKLNNKINFNLKKK
tara:strand:- start:114 stop:848 length:735 start_codon:yes stop_codon:yes gene_type:complete